MNTNNYTTDSESLKIYIKGIRNNEILNQTEEIKLIKKAKNNCKKSKEKLIKANLRFVVSVAYNYQHQGLPLDDIINEGNIGLIKAIYHFDETKDVKFISYALWWIRNNILEGLANQSRIIRYPKTYSYLIFKIRKIYKDFEQKNKYPPNPEDIYNILNEGRKIISMRNIIITLKIKDNYISFNTPITDDNGNSNELIDVFLHKNQETTDNFIYLEELKKEIFKIIETLPENEQKVLIMYFGLNDGKPLIYSEIGKILGICEERARQLKVKAIESLKKRGKYLEQYLY